jgi:hypothetical protein
MHGDTCVPPTYLGFCFDVPQVVSLPRSLLGSERFTFSVCVCASVSQSLSQLHSAATNAWGSVYLLCSQARAQHAARGAQGPIFYGVSGPRSKTRSVLELCSVAGWQAFFREVASHQSRVISSTRKTFLREAASQQSQVSSSARKPFLREAALPVASRQ